MHRLQKGMVALALPLAILLAWTAGAFAHAALLGAEPPDGSVLAASPPRVVLTFNEPVAPTAVRLVDASGRSTSPAAVHGEGARIVVDLPPLARGTHAVSWRVISADGHPVGGTLVLSIGAPDGRIDTRTDTPPALAAAIWAARLALYVGLFVGVGGVVFLAWMAGGQVGCGAPGGRAIDAALVLGLAAALLSFGLQGADTLGLDLGGLLDGATWRAGFGTTYAATLILAAAAMLLAGCLRALPLASPRAVSGFALAGLGLALAASGHASDAQPQFVARPAVFIHAVGLAIWLGALIPLAASLRLKGEGGAQSLARFSRLIPIPLALLVLAGLVLSVLQVGTPAALLATAYGRILVAKLALVALLLTAAAWNRWRLTRRAATPGAGRPALVRLIAAESLLALAILALVAGWRFTPPPRALADVAAASQPARLHVHGTRAMADVTVSPGRAGRVSVKVTVLDEEMAELAAESVDLVLQNAGAGIEPIRAKTHHLEGAAWQADGLILPASGTWSVRVLVLVDDFTQVELAGQITIR